ncbi:MAG: AI-2E family transporter [Clostridia bacterium]|nr:AI-2E family transporter [Clostridia bacterium]
MKTLLKGEKRRIAITAALILFGAILFYELLEHFAPVSRAVRTFLTVVAPILYGLCFAFVVNLPMSFFEKRVFRRLGEKRPGLARGISIFISYVLVLGFITLIIALIMPKVIDSVVTFVTNLGGYIETISNKAEELFEKISISDELADIVDKTLDNLMQKANSFAVSFLQKLPKFTVNAVKVVYSLLVTLVISIHALVKKEKLIGFAKRSVMNMLPDDTAAPILKYGSFTNTTFKKYITGQLVSCLIIGVLCYIGMRIFGMPYPELISVFICVAALVPIVGPWVSTIPSALIILMTRQDNPWLALWFIVMVVGIQQIDDNFVYPRIVGDAVGIPGILVISAAILAGGLFGIGGLLVAVPTAAVLYRIWCDVLKKRTDEKEKERKKKEADPEDPAEALTEA